MHLYLMCGLPGSGKSYKTYTTPYLARFSTDDYWLRPDGMYDFNAKLLGKAHEWTFNNFITRLKTAGSSAIFLLDNTNLCLSDCKRYIDSFPGTVELLEPDTNWRYMPEECFKRNTHGVPLETIQRMLIKMQNGKVELLEYIDSHNELVKRCQL